MIEAPARHVRELIVEALDEASIGCCGTIFSLTHLGLHREVRSAKGSPHRTSGCCLTLEHRFRSLPSRS
jgi:hypothetical protein